MAEVERLELLQPSSRRRQRTCRRRRRQEGGEALVAPPPSAGTPPLPAGRLKKLEELHLEDTQVTDAGCAALAAVLDSGALPALKVLKLDGIPASDAAKAAVYEARANLGVDSESEDGEEGS